MWFPTTILSVLLDCLESPDLHIYIITQVNCFHIFDGYSVKRSNVIVIIRPHFACRTLFSEFSLLFSCCFWIGMQNRLKKSCLSLIVTGAETAARTVCCRARGDIWFKALDKEAIVSEHKC